MDEPTDAPVPEDATANISLGALQEKLQRAITSIAYLTAYALVSKPDPSEEPSPQLRDSLLQLQFSSPPSAEETRKRLERWLCDSALHQFVVVFSAFLEDVAVITAIVHRSKDTSYAVNWKKVRSEVHSKSLRGKLKYIEEQLGVALDADAKERLLSLYQARTCYEHREGVVGQKDVNGKPALVVKWQELEFFGKDPDTGRETIADRLPFTFDEGQAVYQRWIPQEREFPLGSELVFSPKDIAAIGAYVIIQGSALLQFVREQWQSSMSPGVSEE